MPKSVNLSGAQRASILVAGYKIIGAGRRVTYTELSSVTGFFWKTCRLWWGRRETFEQTGSIVDEKKGNSGRPLLDTVSTPEKVTELMVRMEDSPLSHRISMSQRRKGFR